jgi:hypothetical protein
MELSDIFGSFGGFNMSVIVEKAYLFVGLFFLFAIIGGVVILFFHLRAKGSTNKDMKKIGWWQEVTGTESMEPSRMDEVEEIVIPGTPLRVFYCKKRDLWLPRFSRGVSKDLFYVLLTPTQQMVNFTLKGLSSDLKVAGLEYDHTDMLWAAENTREFIKRNYRDKSVKWWQLYQSTIATAAHIMIMTFSFLLILYFMRGMMQDIGVVAGTIAKAVETSCANAATSGVIPA